MEIAVTDPELYFVGDGRRLRITNMFDYYGTETDDPKDAFTIVAELPDGQWLASQCRDGDIVAAISS